MNLKTTSSRPPFLHYQLNHTEDATEEKKDQERKQNKPSRVIPVHPEAD